MEKMMSSSIEELNERLAGLKNLAFQLQSDKRMTSTRLGENSTHDSLVATASKFKVPLLEPLTIGTLLASVLGEIDSDENAVLALTHH
jgi:hypothetical protein